ncbi:NADPH-dependent FMN reductase [Halopelagius fulvigenes]|uniref:NADPH-dependent FMN reductase n=1 Tax=Halopelagius fulvigenes TaxID=1198324 RepID=A0ABD5U016_9EURY
MTDTHVVAVCGSLRERSYTRLSLERVLEAVGEVDATGELLDLREYDLPPMNADREEQGDSAAVVRRIREADAVVLGTPMYHGSYSGVLKNALDYCGFEEFDGKTVGLVAVAGGSFPVTALEHLRSVCRSLNAWVLPHQAAVPNASSQFDDTELANDSIDERLAVLGRRTVGFADIEPDPATFESEENVGAEGK